MGPTLGFLAVMVGFAAQAAGAGEFRPPSVPLVTHDPYFCVWSPADKLTDAWPVHWTGKRNAMQSMVRIDGKTYRLMGPEPSALAAMPQTSLVVTPTRSIYTFATIQVKLTLTFMWPALPEDLDVLARPVTYVTWEAQSQDGKTHAVSVYLDVCPEWTVNTPDQRVTESREQVKKLDVLRAGSVDQRILAQKGDDLRIEWGYLYVAAPQTERTRSSIAAAAEARDAFAASKELPTKADGKEPRPAGEAPVLAFVLDLGKVKAEPISQYVMIAYDDLYGIRYFGTRLRSYWRRKGAEAGDLLQTAAADYTKLISRCMKFDKQLTDDLTAAGGAQYAQIGALAYRQCMAANKIAADANGQPLMFPKENFSNGCVATVDILYPMSPQFMLLSPALMKASLVPIMDYSVSPRWKFPFAPHDLGTYPLVDGQVYGEGETGEENQMPVEESGNMLLMLAALAQIDGNVDFAAKYWPVVSKWAEYLVSKGYDPERQLCTDDFAGHLAHNVNLSAKAILGLGAYAKLADMMGKKDVAATFRQTAKEFAARWVKDAADGDHYKLAFDRPGSWSQKYNLAWDRVLGLNIFPPEVVRTEMAYYRKIQNEYGLPLDSRQEYTKLDWITWTATLTGSREDFEALVTPVWKFLNATPDRVPMTDWYQTKSAKEVNMQARPVVGGVFMRMLGEPAAWKKWAHAAGTVKGNWAPLPKKPEYQAIVPASNGKEGVTWRYTLEKPAGEWYQAGFDDSAWKQGPAGFGSKGTPGGEVRTEWKTSDIWLRRTFELPAGKLKAPLLLIHHDEDAEVYVNGVLAAKASGYSVEYEAVEMNPKALETLKVGANTIAIHCHQTEGGQYIDAGIASVKPAK